MAPQKEPGTQTILCGLSPWFQWMHTGNEMFFFLLEALSAADGKEANQGWPGQVRDSQNPFSIIRASKEWRFRGRFLSPESVAGYFWRDLSDPEG